MYKRHLYFILYLLSAVFLSLILLDGWSFAY